MAAPPCASKTHPLPASVPSGPTSILEFAFARAAQVRQLSVPTFVLAGDIKVLMKIEGAAGTTEVPAS